MKGVVTIIFIAAALMVTLLQCRRDKPLPVMNTTDCHKLSSKFNSLSRREQVLECAHCHETEYNNEQLGPHANSYKMLMAHVNYVHQPAYECQFYAHYVDGTLEKSCINCHAAGNLYETSYAGYLTNPDSIISVWKTGKITLSQARANKEDYITGVDCITCHYNGHSVVTNMGFKAAAGDSIPACAPVASAFFSSDYNCVSCHFDNMTAEHSFYYQNQPAGTSCVSCHQEYDAKGKGTHYYYWRHDPVDKPKSAMLAGFFRPASVMRKKNTVIAYWSNSSMPHPMSECPEWLLSLKVVDKNQHELGSKQVSLNCRQVHDNAMKSAFNGQLLPGAFGINPLYNQSPIAVEIPLADNAPANNLTLICNGYSKPQYWLSDSIGVLQHSSSLAIH